MSESSARRIHGIRGATTVEQNQAEEIIHATD
jgi:chorismate mutase